LVVKIFRLVIEVKDSAWSHANENLKFN
jgi:hypothetical protein